MFIFIHIILFLVLLYLLKHYSDHKVKAIILSIYFIAFSVYFFVPVLNSESYFSTSSYILNLRDSQNNIDIALDDEDHALLLDLLKDAPLYRRLNKTLWHAELKEVYVSSKEMGYIGSLLIYKNHLYLNTREAYYRLGHDQEIIRFLNPLFDSYAKEINYNYNKTALAIELSLTGFDENNWYYDVMIDPEDLHEVDQLSLVYYRSNGSSGRTFNMSEKDGRYYGNITIERDKELSRAYIKISGTCIVDDDLQVYVKIYKLKDYIIEDENP